MRKKNRLHAFNFLDHPRGSGTIIFFKTFMMVIINLLINGNNRHFLEHYMSQGTGVNIRLHPAMCTDQLGS
jgi:hypothetical protein